MTGALISAAELTPTSFSADILNMYSFPSTSLPMVCCVAPGLALSAADHVPLLVSCFSMIYSRIGAPPSEAGAVQVTSIEFLCVVVTVKFLGASGLSTNHRIK